MIYCLLLLALIFWCAIFGLFFYLAEPRNTDSPAPDYDHTKQADTVRHRT